MKLLFIADPLPQFKIHKETTYAMMRAAQAAGHQVWAAESHSLRSENGIRVNAQHIELIEPAEPKHWFNVIEHSDQTLAQYDAVIMRKDPPFDIQYVTDTWMLDAAVREGAKVRNAPSAIRNHSEKVSILEFPELTAPTIIATEKSVFQNFHQKHQDIILKPLDGMGGAGVFRITENAMNLGSVVEVLSNNGQRPIMAQKFLPEIAQGDKRILIIGGQVVPYAVARIPQDGEVRGNMAAGGKAVAQEMSESDWRIANTLAPILWQRGILLAGIDIIGSCLTEINVTSPTGFQEIYNQTGVDVAKLFVEAIEHNIG